MTVYDFEISVIAIGGLELCCFKPKMDEVNKRMFVSEKQKQALIGFLEKEEELRKGKFSATFTSKKAQAKWQDIATKLNSIPGAHKSWLQWKRTWQVLKRMTKKKSSGIKNHYLGTGGGPSSSAVLTNDDERILELVGTTSIAGDKDISESQVNIVFAESEIDTMEIENEDMSPKQKIGEEEADTVTKKNKISRSLKSRNLERSTENAKAIIDVSKEDLITKKQYYEQKLDILRELVDIKREELDLKKEEMEAKRQLNNILEELI